MHSQKNIKLCDENKNRYVMLSHLRKTIITKRHTLWFCVWPLHCLHKPSAN